MKADYDDIRSRIAEAPTWFDERAVPRYCAFHPGDLANIYAREGVLMEIACQECRHHFAVALSFLELSHDRKKDSPDDKDIKPFKSFEDLVRTRHIHYGDPPHIRCCGPGPTMNSIPIRILEY